MTATEAETSAVPCPADIAAIVATLPPLSPAARSRISLLLRPRQQQGAVPVSGAERTAS